MLIVCYFRPSVGSNFLTPVLISVHAIQCTGVDRLQIHEAQGRISVQSNGELRFAESDMVTAEFENVAPIYRLIYHR